VHLYLFLWTWLHIAEGTPPQIPHTHSTCVSFKHQFCRIRRVPTVELMVIVCRIGRIWSAAGDIHPHHDAACLSAETEHMYQIERTSPSRSCIYWCVPAWFLW
jgi:hypothetical protein